MLGSPSNVMLTMAIRRIDEKTTKVGYEIPMTRYFYEYQAPEPVEDIMARITKLEDEISESLRALFHKGA